MTKSTNGYVSDCTNFSTLRDIVSDNLEFYQEDKSECGQKFCVVLESILHLIEPTLKVIDSVLSRANEYDFSKEIQANGHRTYVKLTYKLVDRIIKILEEMTSHRMSYFFRKDYYLREVTAHSQALESLGEAMKCSLFLMGWSEPGSLLSKDKHSPEEMLRKFSMNQYVFYGRCLGFQFCDSMAIILKALCILMASFSEVYYGNGQLIDPILRGSKYWIDPELRAKRCVNISQYASADFCKNFWFLGEMEIVHRLPGFVTSAIAVNEVITLHPTSLVLQNIYGKEVDIPVPSSHIGPGPVSARLLSASPRLGMEIEGSSKSGLKFPSPYLVFHCHGGGYVAQSSRSHEIYLRQWALSLDTPVLSIDYSLAPEAPYPRALEEVFYFYCWVLSNPARLGTTAEKIVFAGDSAGANLNIALTMMCLDYGVRPPDGLFIAYAPVIMSLAPSPSRLLTLIDPLLPFGFVMGCCKAYTCSPEEYAQSTVHEKKLRRKINSSEIGKNNSSPKKEGASNGEEEVGTSPDCSEDQSPQEDESSRPALMCRSQSAGFLSRWMTSLSNHISGITSPKSFPDQEEEQLDREMAAEAHLPCPLDALRTEFPNDPYISPFFASDALLSNFPPVAVLTTELDPFLDDCVDFAKKLRSLDVDVTLDVLPGLCHGFLNFSMVSKEAGEGSKLCVERISELLSSSQDVGEGSSAAEDYV